MPTPKHSRLLILGSGPAGYTAAVAGVGRRCIISVHLVTGGACQ